MKNITFEASAPYNVYTFAGRSESRLERYINLSKLNSISRFAASSILPSGTAAWWYLSRCAGVFLPFTPAEISTPHFTIRVMVQNYSMSKIRVTLDVLAFDVLPYLKTDHALYAAMGDTHKRYRLDMEHNNWWECFVYTPEGEFHDMMWALDSDHIFEGVEVVLSAMDSVMKDITENKERIEYGKDSAFYC